MNIKKIGFLALAGLVFALASCASNENLPSTTITPSVPTSTPTTIIPSEPEKDMVNFYDGDTLYHSYENVDGVITQPENPTKEKYEFDGWFTNPDCNEFSEFDFDDNIQGSLNLYAKWNKCYSINFVSNMEGISVDPINVSTIGSLPTPKKSGYSFLGWFTDNICYRQLARGTELTDDITLYGRWETAPELGYELYETNLDVDNNLTSGTDADNDIRVNGFSIIKGTEVRDRTKEWSDGENTLYFIKSIKIADNKQGIQFTVQGPTQIEMYAQNGSGSATYKNVIFSNLSGGTSKTIKISGTESVTDNSGNIIYEAGSPICKIVTTLEAGTYLVNRDTGTLDIYYLRCTSTLERSSECGFEITNTGTTEFFEGQRYKYSNVIVSQVFKNGRTNEIGFDNENLTIDYSNYKKTAGVYTITISYKNYESQSFDVYVYGIEDMDLSFYTNFKSSQNSAYDNGKYVNGATKQIYSPNQEFDSSYIVVKITAVHPETGEQKQFKLANGWDIDTSNFDNSKAGIYNVSVYLSFKTEISAEFSVYVIDTPVAMNENVAQVCVDKSYTGELGAVVDGYNTFVNIQQALEFIENAKLDANIEKLLYIKDGLYNEKLEVVTPNLTIKGESKDNTIIEWNSLYGVADESGFVQTTDSTASVAIRDTAVNCTILDITISNYWNSQERFDKDLGEGYSEHRALALLVQSDKFYMNNCALLGYQDTLELFTGRQYISNTYICGITDFIFGTNNTTYFYQCEIRSIYGKNGYITAFKGLNKGLNIDDIKYGAIFDECDFTADNGVDDGKTAIGRTWGEAASVMIMNSNLGIHIAKTDSGRYIHMNAPVDAATVKFLEYNNTGDGAITSAVKGCSIPQKSVADTYKDFNVIFGKTNLNVTYDDVWNPNSN